MQAWLWLLGSGIAFLVLIWWVRRKPPRTFDPGYTIPVVPPEKRYQENESWVDFLNKVFLPAAFIALAVLFLVLRAWKK